jgi:hypothetical protein
MGGLALKHLEGMRRYKPSEFYRLATDIIPRIEDTFGTRARLVKSYRSKRGFGDMDILVLNEGRLPHIQKTIQSEFSPRAIISNGSVYSFDHQNFQIDLIITPKSNWETSQVFFAYNDLGNLMGKLFHKFGLKYGFDGLKYIYRIDDKKLGEITVTKDMQKAFAFIGLSYDRFLQGFNDLEEIFDFVIGSPYFQKEAFFFENLNAINKKRNRRRINYKRFIRYVNRIGKYENLSPLPDAEYRFDPDKSKYFSMIDEFFPESNFMNQLHALREKENRKRLVHSKFNGNLVMDRYPNLKGRELGSMINSFKSQFENLYEFEKFVINSSEDYLWNFFHQTCTAIKVN